MEFNTSGGYKHMKTQTVQVKSEPTLTPLDGYSFLTQSNRVEIKKNRNLVAYWYGNHDDLKSIVRTVRSHEALLEAAKNVLIYCEDMLSRHFSHEINGARWNRDELKKAIAQAEKGE